MASSSLLSNVASQRHSVLSNTPRLALALSCHLCMSEYECETININDTTRLVLVIPIKYLWPPNMPFLSPLMNPICQPHFMYIITPKTFRID